MKTHHYKGDGHPATCLRVPDTIANKTTDYLGRSMFQVEPMPKGAEPIYDKDLDAKGGLTHE